MKNEYDVIVAGGGFGGVCAAVAAGRAGLKVLLVEKYGFLGGMATAGLVNPFMAYRASQKNSEGQWETWGRNGQIIASPIFVEIIDRLRRRGAIDEHGSVFDDEILKPVLDEICIEAGVELLFHAFTVGAKVKGGKITAVTVAVKSETVNLQAKVFIDGTGDGDLAYFAGCPFEMGRGEEDESCQPMTLCFRAGGVTGFSSVHELAKSLDSIYQEEKKGGTLLNKRENVLVFGTLRPDVLHFNSTRVIGKNGTDAEAFSSAEVEGRKQVMELFSIFKAKAPEFKDAFILKMAAQIGVRETRRTIGSYILTVDDVVNAKVFEDGIARSSYPVDIHSPSGEGTDIRTVNGEYYEIPYRCIVPEDIRNLLMACRAISSTHEAHSSLRVMPVVASVGEAAGRAAVKAISSDKQVGEIDGKELKAEIFGA